MLLEQKKYLTSKVFMIHKAGLNFEERYLFKRSEFEIPFEHIIEEPVKYFYTSKVKFWVMVILGTFFFCAFYEQFIYSFPKVSVLFFYGSLTIVGFLSFWFSREELYIFNTSSVQFAMYSKRPSEQEVHEFISELFKQREKYFENVFTITPTNISNVDELYKLNYLLKEKAITQDEFEKLKAEILKRNSIQNDDISSN